MDWQVAISFVGMIGIPLAGAVYAHVRSLSATNDARHNELKLMTATVSKELYEFKIQVATQYATLFYMKDIESRFLRSVDRVEEKLDRLLDRNMRKDSEEST